MYGVLFLVGIVGFTLAIGWVVHRSDRIHCNRLTAQQKRELGKMVDQLQNHAPFDN
jgi:hypothetical protein